MTCSATLQGRRPYQEDRVTEFPITRQVHAHLLCDGHGGAHVSEFFIQTLPELVRQHWHNDVKKNRKPVDLKLAESIAHCEALLDKSQAAFQGSTCLLTVTTPSTLIVMNVGDSRCLVISEKKHYVLNRDHKPLQPQEKQRIETLGGSVDVGTGRIGQLNVSRTVGDFAHKPFVCSAAESRLFHRHKDPSKSFVVVMATDGLWDVLSNEDVAEYVRQRVKQGIPYKKIAEDLCLLGFQRGSLDNITVVVTPWLSQRRDKKS